MLKLAGYTVTDQIDEGYQALVYRGYRTDNKQPVIIKVLKSQFLNPHQVARLHDEYKMNQQLELPGIIKIYDLQQYKDTWVFIMEDIHGDSLKNIIATETIDLNIFLPIAIQLADLLAHLHAIPLIHGNVKPAHIIVNLDTNQVKMTDFSGSSSLPQQYQFMSYPTQSEGVLNYLAPEQTGCVNRMMDYRTDLYSLGIVFYEMLVGHPPFKSKDAMELVYWHIAKQPSLPHTHNAKIPLTISKLVMKLLAKAAEDRYQSAQSLKADLQTCFQQWNTTKKIESFRLAQANLTQQLLISQKLYGRTSELETVLHAVKRTTTSSASGAEITLVSGESGIGKTTLIKEIYPLLTRQRSYFIYGKCDPLQHHSPRSALIQAFSQLIQHLLTENETKQNEWRHKLLAALAPNAQLIIEMIPQLEGLLGKQPPLQTVDTIEAQNRFNWVWLKFSQVFAQPESPLVILLDDLQWADVETLNLVELMITEREINTRFFGAYQYDQVNPSHPLIAMLNRLQQQEVIINYVTLTPLSLESVTQWLSETLFHDSEVVKPLAEWVMQQTQGNPLVIQQLFNTLAQADYFHLVSNSVEHTHSVNHHWHWNLTQIINDESDFTIAINEFINNKIKQLPKDTQNILCLAASIGSQFDLTQLAISYEQSIAATYQDLLPALQASLIVKYHLDNNSQSSLFAFSHDQVQQAAYTLLQETDKMALHLRIGQHWLANTSDEEQIDTIFDLVAHLNKGRLLLFEPKELLELAQLNLAAAYKAKGILAYQAARTYLTIGMACLTDQDWLEHHELAFALYKESAEIEYLNGHVELADTLSKVMLARTNTVLEKVAVYDLLVRQYRQQNQAQLAITVGYQALQLLDIELPLADLSAALEQELQTIEPLWRGKAIITWLAAPQMTLPEKQATITLLTNLARAVADYDPTLFNLIQVKMAHLSLQYGHIAESTLSYAYYGFLLSNLTNEYQKGYEFAHLALKLSQKFNYRAQQGPICLILANQLLPWLKPLKQVQRINRSGQQASLATGHFQTTGELLFNTLLIQFYQGESLSILYEETAQHLSFCQKIRQVLATDVMIGYQLIISNLLGKTEHKLSFSHGTLTEEHYLATCEQNHSFKALSIYYLLKAQVLYLYGYFTEALSCSHLAEHYLSTLPGSILIAAYHFYSSLILLALYPQATPAEQQNYQAQLEISQQQMNNWAQRCPENFQHQYLLVQAEQANLLGNIPTAMDLYDNAIQSASTNEVILEAALANELAARFWLNHDKEAFAQLYLTKAYTGYQHWGAANKIAQLLEHYPTLLLKTETTAQSLNREVTPTTSTTTLSQPERSSITSTIASGEENTLKLMQIMKASQIISGEIELPRLLKKIMQIVVENVGAEQGWLILQKDISHSPFPLEESNLSNTNTNESTTTGHEISTSGLFIEAYATLKKVQLLKPIPLEWVDRNGKARNALSRKIIDYIAQTQKPLVLNEPDHYQLFTHDIHRLPQAPLSALGMPIIKSKQLIGIFYLENNLINNAFTPERLAILKLLATQIAISIENARFYTQLEQARFAEIQSRHLAEQARTDAEAASRAKTSFLANMSHELRTPLNAILGYSEMIQEEAEELGYEGILPDLEKIQTAGIQLLGIISDILDVSKIEADKLELNLTKFSIIQLVEDMVTTIQLMVEMEGNQLKIECEQDLGTLYADYHKVGQILLNLLNNASKFTNQGIITLTITRETLFSTPLDDETQTIESDWLFFQVADTGIGIPAEQINLIFEAFTQADNSPTREYGGTGLGLTISDRFCRAMGGHITVSSEVGKGSVFTVHLPAVVTES